MAIRVWLLATAFAFSGLVVVSINPPTLVTGCVVQFSETYDCVDIVSSLATTLYHTMYHVLLRFCLM